MKRGTPVKIYCLNLRCGYIRDLRDGRENMIRTRQHRVYKQIKEYDPDVIAFQECTSGWRALLEDGILDGYTFFHKWTHTGLEIKPGGTDLITNPVCWKTDKYDVLDKGWFWLSPTPEVSSGYEGDEEHRIVVWVQLKDKKTGAEFYFHSTHFALGEGDRVIFSGRQLARRFHAFPEGTNAFFMGDLNSPYRSYSYCGWAYEPGLKDLRDAAEAMGKDGLCKVGELKGTYNGFKAPEGYGFNDHIVCKPNKTMAIDTFKVIYDMVGVPERNIPEGYVSDHFALYTEVRLDTDEDYGKYYEFGDEAKERLPETGYPTRQEWNQAHGR